MSKFLRLRSALLCAAAMVMTRPLLAQPVCLDGLCFVDRGASGEIVLGPIRGGLAVIDYDSDGYQDLVLSDLPGLPSRIFRNVPDANRPGNRTFLDVTAGSGLDDGEGVSSNSFGVLVADYDNDGDSDVFMTGSFLGGLLYRNDGGGHFTNVSLTAGVRVPKSSAICASWHDLNQDGFVDLMLVGSSSNAGTLRLLMNNGDGTFQVSTGIVPFVSGRGIAYSHLWTDYDSDGHADLFIPFTAAPMLLRNVDDGAGGRRLVDVTQAAGFRQGIVAPMGIAAGDWDNDGDFDFAITDALDGTYYEGLNGRVVRVAPMFTIFGWGTTWLDADNDGWIDNYQAGSHSTASLDRLNRNLGHGVFQDVTLALNGFSFASQHMVQMDFNNDGRQDLVTINPGTTGQTISIYENVSTTLGHWINIRLRGDGIGINRDAIGAVVRVATGNRSQIRQVLSGSSTTATEDMRLHFGLGEAGTIDAIEVIWPTRGERSARTYRYEGPFAADQFLEIEAPAADCNGNRIPDYLDIADGLEEDCTANGVPDSCEPDADGNGVADSCDFAAQPGPQQEPDGVAKSRFISLLIPDLPQAGPTAIRVRLGSLHRPQSPQDAPDFSSLEGQFRYVNTFRDDDGSVVFECDDSAVLGTSYSCARLGCAPEYRDWHLEFGGQVLHVTGDSVVPSSQYQADFLSPACQGFEFRCTDATDSLAVSTAPWGDVGDGLLNILDVSAVVDKLHELPRSLPEPQTLFQPASSRPDRLAVSVLDLSAVVGALRGEAYPFAIQACAP